MRDGGHAQARYRPAFRLVPRTALVWRTNDSAPHDLIDQARKAWVAGPSPAMTRRQAEPGHGTMPSRARS
jgi:hypothetical protein